jgi:hypothetical protein
MSHNKRVHTIETSLTPKAGVLFWLEDMLQSSHDSYLERLIADRSNPRVAVVRAVGEAVRENLSYPRLKPEQLEQAVREAQKQADTLILLVLNLHERVRSASKDAVVSIELIYERGLRMMLQAMYQDRSEPKEWDWWRDKLTVTLTSMLIMREIVTSISAKYYDCNPLLFAGDQERLNEQIALLEDTSKMYTHGQHALPHWKPITIPSTAEHVEALVELLVDGAKAQTLAAFGEDEAARELLESCGVRAHRKVKQLLSPNSRQDTTS